ncbi:MAG: GNAT family N-acetyltransferase [Actinomycetota bacterium]|nr:GNAT family N-acetyltransferase [Actinomycetota bacterium]
MSGFEIRAMSREDAEAVAGWHYDPPYDFYDFRGDPDDLGELLDPNSWVDDYHAVDLDGELVGFFSFKRHDDALEIGLGLRPDLTGKSLGAAFVDAGLAYALERFSPRELFLDVATFNDRAKKVYERAGFRASHVWIHESRQGRVEFLRMTRPA